MKLLMIDQICNTNMSTIEVINLTRISGATIKEKIGNDSEQISHSFYNYTLIFKI